ncbi:MAG: sterol desaturase family protein, partial [Cellvibrionaceae bacterium]|nr:sterol desaturase family protein [Cellvibrionaceae bacterium]
MDSLAEALVAPLGYLFEPNRRLYWLFLLSSLLLASITVSLQAGRFDIRAQVGSLLQRSYWLNRSTAIDVCLLFINSAFRLLLVVPVLGSHLSATILVGSFLQDSFGDAPVLALPALAIGLAYTLVFFICEDWSRFTLHLAMHKCPWLWRVHRLHHSATTLTPLTVHRVNPLEMSLYYLRGLLVFALVSGVFLYLFRNKLNVWTILGV